MDYDISEDTLAAYVLGEIIFGANTSLMGGVRVENTKNEYTANELVVDEEGDPVGLTPVTGDKSYTEWLPQFHLVYKTGKDSQLRAAVTRSLARPNFEDMAPWRYVNDRGLRDRDGEPRSRCHNRLEPRPHVGEVPAAGRNFLGRCLL